ncbi:response regulator [Gimesia chilikensis]|uniref:ATP-binding protein n=1 Tax=Gimesia chilikensis TaxID=2605989 RepID=UPI0011EDC9EC|nr:ATP-binding protein [Gimesia chilikensis]KAA0140970.1 response regulator [Gimesia chilikensis]
MHTYKPLTRVSAKLRKWSISDRLKCAFGLLVLVQVVSGAVTLYQLSNINHDISQLVTVEEPLEASILEMEIEAGKMARAVLDYVRDRDKEHLEKLILARDHFQENYRRYQKLAQSDLGPDLNRRIESDYAEYNRMSAELVRLVDKRDASLHVFVNYVKQIDQLIGKEHRETNRIPSEAELIKADASHNMEKYLNITFGSIEEYIVQRNQNLLMRIFDAERKFRMFEAQYLLSISNQLELQRMNEIDSLFEKATTFGNQIVNVTDDIDHQLAGYEQKLETINELLHNQIHPLIHANTVKATYHADASIQSAILVISILAFIGTIFALFSVWIISRGIVSPILELSRSAEKIAAGDVDHRIQVESQDEVGRLANTFNHMVEDLVIAQQEAENASKIKTAFLANMSHEIRTPMTAILGFAEIMRQRNQDSETLRHLDTIKKNGEYLLELINDILDVSKIEADKLDVEAIECSLTELVDDVKTLMEIRAIDKGLDLSIQVEGQVPNWIESDPVRLRQILINLLSNAIKFTREGTVQLVLRAVTLDSNEQGLQFDVIDTGIGMTETQLSRLFQPFVQADCSTTRKFGGTGLGLTICKRLTHILGGEISVSSEYSKGTIFTVTVKTGNLQTEEYIDQTAFARQGKQNVLSQPKSEGSESYRILVAEDGPDNQRLIRYFLQKAGHDVTLAENGLIAVKLAQEAVEKGNAFDVILMDMQMPELDGYGATKQLRASGYRLPIIALTAHSMSGSREECLAAGCDSFATKPIQLEQLSSIMHECVINSQEQAQLNL